jgi:glycosyltransferase involved in cell wall biosynthesis
VAEPAISALIRCRDEERGIGRLIDALRGQTIAASIEIVVIDSGSQDRTLEEVRSRGIDPLEIGPEEFSYGRALNLAANAARGPLCVSISAHARPKDSGWAERMVRAFENDRVACAFGQRMDPDEACPLAAPLLQDLGHAEAHPFWGYANSAGGFRRALWSRRPFDEELIASEDLEWALYWQRQGWLVLLDPALDIEHSHRDEGPVRTFRRIRNEVACVSEFQRVDPLPLRGVMAEWWNGPHLHRSHLRARLDPRRIGALAGKYVGLRHLSPDRSPDRTQP